jgi:hypothetical protein
MEVAQWRRAIALLQHQPSTLKAQSGPKMDGLSGAQRQDWPHTKLGVAA